MNARAPLLLLILAACGPSNLNSVQGDLFVSPPAADFGDVYAGERATRSLQVTNSLKLSQSLQLTAPLPPFDAPLRLDVPGGSSAALILGFRPTRPGPFAAVLRVGAEKIALKGNGLAVPECRAPANPCNTSHFDTSQAACVLLTRPDGVACAGRCVTEGMCSNGGCVGAFVSCDDGDACTQDSCTDEKGCIHPAKSCPSSPTNPCRLGSCDSVKGCQLIDAADGTSCGPKNCRTTTTRVCISAQCVDRPLPAPECLNQFGYLKASNADATDAFGTRLAISADGSTLAVGASAESSNGIENDNSAPQSGAVYVFRRIGGLWIQEAYVKARNWGAGDAFGYSVALSADGSTLVVGAHLEDGNGSTEADNSAKESGAAYVFQRTGSTWEQQAYLKATNVEQGDKFGGSVAISGDGNVVAVGATGEDSALPDTPTNNAADEAGAVYVYYRVAGAWLSHVSYLKASNPEGGDLFGFSLSLSRDGTTLAVGALGEDSKATGVNGPQADNSAPQSGAVYLFRTAFTLGWTQSAYVKASNTGAADIFGIAVALSGDGSTLAVGAYGEDSSATGVNGDQADNAGSQSGAAYVFRKTLSQWSQDAYVKAANTALGDDFGFALALSGDGATLAVGAFSENSGSTGIDGHPFNKSAPDSGAVYLFRRTTRWAQDAYIKASNTDPADGFGYGVSIAGDGTVLAVGAPGEDSSGRGINPIQSDNAAADSGAVYVFAIQ